MMNQEQLTTELDELLVPAFGGRKTYPILSLTGGYSYAPANAMYGFGQAPMHYVTTRGPEQDGETPVSMQWDARTMQLSLRFTQNDRQYYWWVREKVLRLVNANRSFSATSITPYIYRKKFPAGKKLRGSDAQVENGSNTVLVSYGRFFDLGGLIAGNQIILNGVAYKIESCPNDYTVILTTNYAGATGTVGWEYKTNQTTRDLYCLPESGPTLDLDAAAAQNKPFGFFDVVRFVAHYPFWYGAQQTETWALPDDFGDLIFDNIGGYFGATRGEGRWLFDFTAISEFVDVVYWGNYRARPILVITGPATSISFQNQTTGLSIQVETTIAAGESITIDTLNTTVTKSDGTNLLPVTSGDLSFFSIEPENADHSRVNRIFVGFSGAADTSTAVMYWQNAYTGI